MLEELDQKLITSLEIWQFWRKEMTLKKWKRYRNIWKRWIAKIAMFSSTKRTFDR